MAKNKKENNAPAENTNDQNAPATAETPAKQKAKRGTSIDAQLKNHFRSIMSGFINGVDNLTEILQAAVSTYEALPVAQVSVGLSLDQKLAEANAAVDAWFNNNETDRDKLTLLLARQKKLKTEKDKADKAGSEQADTASA